MQSGHHIHNIVGSLHRFCLLIMSIMGWMKGELHHIMESPEHTKTAREVQHCLYVLDYSTPYVVYGRFAGGGGGLNPPKFVHQQPTGWSLGSHRVRGIHFEGFGTCPHVLFSGFSIFYHFTKT